MPDAILTLNAGSSSIKFALYEVDGTRLNPISHGQVENIGAAPHFIAKNQAGAILKESRWPGGAAQTHEVLLHNMLAWIDAHLGSEALTAVGHRVVHGGPHHDHPELITDSLMEALDGLTPLAPLHQPHNLSAIRAISSLRPGLPQVACFDTGFHHTMPEVAKRIALPRKYAAEGVRRYGFHGLSYEYIARRLKEIAPDLAHKRVIVAHLGNGASLCAIDDGCSMDTTMSFTALEGLVMGTRCGSIDPGVILYLEQEHGMDAKQVETLLYEQSGLLGVSGVSSDMRVLLASTEQTAREAIELFVFRIAREVGALTSSLGGLDGFVFAAGIGENSAEIRVAVCERLTWLGVALDPEANKCGASLISVPGSRVEVRVVATDEEAMIARHTLETIQAS